MGDFNGRLGIQNQLTADFFQGSTLFESRDSLDITFNREGMDIVEIMQLNTFVLVNSRTRSD